MKKILAFCFSLLAMQAYAQNYNDRSTTGPVPPKGVDVVGYVSTSKAENVTRLISGVPAYLWKEGCGPTVVGMLAGYYDSHGFPNLLPGDASTQTAAVNTAIATTEHINDYAKPNEATLPVQPDKSELPAGDEHTDNCIADYMLTSRSIIGNIWGWSKGVDIKPAWENYIANFASEYEGSCTQYYYDSSTWDTLVSNIDHNKPMLLLVDTNIDGLTDHFVIANGYKIENDINYYACFNTWDAVQHWYEFRQMASGVSWGVARCYTFSIHNKLPVPAGAISGLTSVCKGAGQVDYSVPPIADATSYIWTLPSGATGTSSTNTISVTFGAGAVSGDITVKGHNLNGDGTPSSLAITVNDSPSEPVVGTVTQPTCIVPSGSVVLSGLPSTGTWTVTRSPGGTTYQGTGTTTTISGLSSGSYTFTVTNAAICISSPTSEVTINSNPVNPDEPVTDLTQPTCSVSTGTITVTSPKGTGMTYSINGTTYTNTNGIFTSVSPGIYSVTAKNSSGCISSAASVTINSQPSTPSTPEATLVQPSCLVSTGTITITSPVGTGMTYSINGSTYTNTTGIFSSVSPAVYTITAKGSSGCISNGTIVTINSQPSTPSTPVVTLVQTSCLASTGTITVTSPKAAGMTYSINGTTYTNTTGIFSPVAAGTHSVTAKNSSGCISSATSVSINVQPSTPSAPVATLVQPTCLSSTGTITITSPKEGGMDYSMNGSTYTNTSGIFSSVGPGTYPLTARNSAGCISQATNVTINSQPATPSSPVTSLIQPTCTEPTGTIHISSPTGTGMTYSINGSTYTNTTGTFASVFAGPYTVTAKNSVGCISSGTNVTINNQPDTPEAPSATLIQPTCSVSTGTITITSPKEAGMHYSINGSSYTNTSGVFTSVVSGNYTLTAKNMAGCISTGTNVTINAQPSTPDSPEATLTQPSCSISTGSVSITSPSGPGMTYSINGTIYANSTGTFTSLAAGTYPLTAKNSSGCISPIAYVTINQQPETPPAPDGFLVQPDCSVTTGSVEITSPKGPGYTYSIDGVHYTNTTGLFTQISPGSYSITAKNQAGCISSGIDITIIAHAVTPQTPVITLNDNILHSSASLGNNWYKQDGIISNATAQNYTALVSDIYYVIVTVNGCSSAPSNSINVVITGDENPASSGISLKAYPNPFDRELIIERAGTNDVTGFEILNSLGQPVIKGEVGENTVIETSSLSRGVYFLRVKNGRSFEHIKLIRK